MANEKDKAGQHEEAEEVEAVLAEFDGRKEVLEEMCARTKSLIEACLEDADIPYQSVQTRVKSRKKLQKKYEDVAKNYKRLDDITDLAGLRVITYYEDDVDKVADVIGREFEIDQENSVDRRETEPDRFGYYALNYVCTHTDQRSADVEYKRFAGVCCEVQITSILRHAWSEIQHDWYDMKAAFPHEIKRRFARMAALLEIAESEFMNLRKMRSSYLRSVDVQVEAEVLDLPLDRASLAAFIEKDRAVAELDLAIASYARLPLSREPQPLFLDVIADAARFAGLVNLNLLREAVAKYGEFLIEYLKEADILTPGRKHGRELARGLSVFHTAMMIAGKRGERELLELMKRLNLSPSGNLNASVKARAHASEHIFSRLGDHG